MSETIEQLLKGIPVWKRNNVKTHFEDTLPLREIIRSNLLQENLQVAILRPAPYILVVSAIKPANVLYQSNVTYTCKRTYTGTNYQFHFHPWRVFE